MSLTTNENERMNRPLDVVDRQIADLLRDEARRQSTGLELIPSENLVSEAVLEAMGSIFTNKYAEGYPGKRYYGGYEYADKVEQLAIDRAKELVPAVETARARARSSRASFATRLARNVERLFRRIGAPLEACGDDAHHRALGEVDEIIIEHGGVTHKQRGYMSLTTCRARRGLPISSLSDLLHGRQSPPRQRSSASPHLVVARDGLGGRVHQGARG